MDSEEISCSCNNHKWLIPLPHPSIIERAIISKYSPRTHSISGQTTPPRSAISSISQPMFHNETGIRWNWYPQEDISLCLKRASWYTIVYNNLDIVLSGRKWKGHYINILYCYMYFRYENVWNILLLSKGNWKIISVHTLHIFLNNYPKQFPTMFLEYSKNCTGACITVYALALYFAMYMLVIRK